MKALQIAATGMSAQQTRVDTISNNLANMSTTGYNARRAEFADLAYQQAVRPGSIAASDAVDLSLVEPVRAQRDLERGHLGALRGDRRAGDPECGPGTQPARQDAEDPRRHSLPEPRMQLGPFQG